MVRSPTADELLQAASRHGAAAEWAQALRLLRERADLARAHPQLAALRAEAELRTGHAREARQWLSDVLPLIERSRDRSALRRALNQLGVADVELGALDEAVRTFARALDLARTDGDDLLVAHSTNNMGAIASMRGRRSEALTLYQLAIPAYQRLGHVAGLAQSHHNMAISYRHLGQLELAADYERRAAGYALECGNTALLALVWLGRADLSLETGDAALAEVEALRAARHFAEAPDPIREADALRATGAARLALNRLADAGTALERAAALAHGHGSRLVEGEIMRLRAEHHLRVGDRVAARAAIAAAIGVFEELGATVERDEAIAWEAAHHRQLLGMDGGGT